MGPDRFPREIQILAQMQHPHILPLHDSGEAGGVLYFVMPFVEGETLGERIARIGPLPIGETVRLLRQIADALAYAHARGIVHRDIKPDNVMLSGKHATVTDFGVAKAVQSSAKDRHTAVGIAVGTPHYMAPEQATADERIDHRADLYALGVLGYEMLTGAPLFDGETPQAILSAHWLQPPPDIRERRADVPAGLADALLRCVAKEPDDRWPTADALLAALEAVEAGGTGDRLAALPPVTLAPPRDPLHSAAGGSPARATTAAPPALAATVPPTRRWLPAVGGVATAALIVAGFLLRPGRGGPEPIRKIGVLPVEDISGQDAVFVTAMHDGLTAALSRLQLSGVASRSEMLRYKGTAKTTREIARENELGAVVEATVFRAGEVMRINVQFTDPETSRALWSETIERNVSDVLQAQDAVVQVVARGVRDALTAKPGASE
jgi:serine/threonine-protein kinase